MSLIQNLFETNCTMEDLTVSVENGPTNISNNEDMEDFNGGLMEENPFLGVPIAVVMSVLCLLTVFGNTVVLHAIRTERRLQTVSNVFIMSLAIADLTVGLVVMPISTIYVLMGRWHFGLAVCQFWLSADYSASTASILNLLVLSLDRYWSISRPLEYLRRRSKRRALIVITIVWIGSFMWIVPIIGWHAFFGGWIRKQPSDVCETEFADNVIFKLTTSILNFYCPMVAMIVTYARIYWQIRKRARSEVMNRCSGDTRPDSFSSAEQPQNRYSLAAPIANYNRKSKKAKKKKKVLKSADAEKANCDGAISVADARWRCNMCGATQNKVEEWSWPRDEHKKQQVSPQPDDPSSKESEEENSRTNKILLLRRSKRPGSLSPTSTPGVSPPAEINNIIPTNHLRVPDHHHHHHNTSTSSISRNSSFRSVLRRRPSSRRSVASLRQETKAARQLGVILGAFVLCWMPYMVLFVVSAACSGCLGGPGMHTAAIWLGYLNSTVNPVIYALCNASFKRAFWKIGAGVTSGWRRKCRRRDNTDGMASENNPFA